MSSAKISDRKSVQEKALTASVEVSAKRQRRRFSSAVLDWYAVDGRKDLPWQHNPTPYRVWVSEIMLQQTQVTTVIPYFERFMQRFSSVDALAAASQDDVLSLWTGLGYYARGRNLHKAAQIVVREYDSVLPQSLDELVALPGIGRSTAGAILSLGSGQHAAILDGNVKRVLCRYFCVEGWYGQTAVERHLWALTTALTPMKNSGRYNQAMMDLGATLCTRSTPDCPRCPLQKHCLAYRSGSPTDWPHKKPRKNKPVRRTLMLLALKESAVLLQKRPPSGIWGGLWSFPQFDDDDSLQRYAATLGRFEVGQVERWDKVQHSFSHFDLEITPVKIALKPDAARHIMEQYEDCCWVDGEMPGGCAAPVKRLLDKLTHTLL